MSSRPMFQEGANLHQDVVATFATKRSVKLQRADAMKAILLLLLLSTCRTSAQSRASLKVTPNWSQFFEYEHISLSCERIASGQWTVWRSPAKKGLKVSDCTSGWGIQTSSTCEIKRVTHSDSGVYWCQSTHGHSSNAISITVNENPVILLSPAAPVVEGENITLLCRTKNPSNLPANFFKDDHSIKSETANHTTIYQASKADQGSYKCHISGHGESPSSWLLIQDHSDLPTLTLSPNSAQMFEYKDLNLSCGIQGWTVKRFSTFDKQVSGCEVWGKATSYGCILHKIKGLDSAVYWCESPTHQRSNSVNITVYERENTPVILQSPVLPVMKGDSVTLLCESKNSQSDIPATFYKNESIIGTAPRSHMIIYNVTKSHEGIYKCNMSVGVSPSSWLFVIDPEDPDAPTSDPHKNLSSLGILRYILVCFPYVISTFLMASIYRMSAGRSSHVSITMPPPTEEDEDQSYDDVMADVTTEHNF